MSELEIREFQIREVNTEERSVAGLAVPYNQTTSIGGAGGFEERVEKGAFGTVGKLPLFYGHNHRQGWPPIGKVVEVRDSEEGLYIKAHISETPAGNDVYTLLRDGVLDKFSIGFSPLKDRLDGEVVVREKASLKEVSIVAIPAYTDAAVSEVRADTPNNKENVMTEVVNASGVEELREDVADIKRRMTMLSEQGAFSGSGESQFRSIAEAVHAIGQGKGREVAEEVRAWTGNTNSFDANDNATRPAWINKALQLVEAKRPITALFGKAPLPATGMSYVYPQVTATTGSAAVQVNEGDDLPFVSITVGTATNSIVTVGVASTLSVQVLERSDVAFLDGVLRTMYNEYAVLTEGRVATALVGAAGAQGEFLTGGLAGATVFDWIDSVSDSAGLIEDNANGAAAEVVIVSRDVFRSLARLKDTTNRPLFVINGDGVNSVGNLNVRGLSGTIAGFPVVVVPGLPAGYAAVVSSEALTVREDALKSLQDQNIINLTKDFSVYGYHSVDLSNPQAIVRIDTDGTA